MQIEFWVKKEMEAEDFVGQEHHRPRWNAEVKVTLQGDKELITLISGKIQDIKDAEIK